MAPIQFQPRPSLLGLGAKPAEDLPSVIKKPISGPLTPAAFERREAEVSHEL
jgi:hypothetical protein